jgi:hypothetical protein
MGGGAVGQEAVAGSGGAVGLFAIVTDFGYSPPYAGGGAVGWSAETGGGGGAVGSFAQSDGFGGAVGADATEEIGGGAIGWSSYTMAGGAVGYLSHSSFGGAVGQSANESGNGFAGGECSITANGGGAVGQDAVNDAGFSGGNYAICSADGTISGTPIDAIQLGTGSNTNLQTMQVYSNVLLDVTGRIPSARAFADLPPVYTNNSDAVTGGLLVGQVYRTGGDPDVLCIVH